MISMLKMTMTMGDGDIDQLGLFGGYSADVSAISVYYWPLDVSYTLYT